MIKVFVNEANNDQASQAVDIVMNYIKKNPSLGLSIQLIPVEGNRTDSKKFLENSMWINDLIIFFRICKIFLLTVCSVYTEAVKNSQPPHIVFDTTITNVASETVKSLTSALGLPTVSASFGQEGDIRQWRDINEQKRQYLLQVMPPADIIPEVIRSIIVYMNITNAAILYDESFGKLIKAYLSR